VPNFNEVLLDKLTEYNIPIIFKRLLIYLITHYVQLIKFTTVGFTTFGINLLSFHIFYGLVQLDYKIAVSIAYVISVISHFLLHRSITYRATEQALAHNLWKYLLMLAVNYAITLTVMWFVVNVVKKSPYIGLVATTAITAIVSFFVMKYFVFESKPKQLK